MLVQHAHGSFDLAAHGIHYAVLGAGVLGLVALLPQQSLPRAPAHLREPLRSRQLLVVGAIGNLAVIRRRTVDPITPRSMEGNHR
jgi:hypothetical protein